MVKFERSDARNKALETAMAHIRKQHGKGSIMSLGDNDSLDVEEIPTGSLGLDIALGLGGIPRGRIIEVYGGESAGKTTLALSIAASVQRLGGRVAFVDAEHALDPEWAALMGVVEEDTMISQPDTGEQGLQIVEKLASSGAVDLIIVDSVAALTPKAEIEGDIGDSHVGLQARLMSQSLRKLAGVIKQSNCTVIFINQLRMKIGVMFGNPETTTGGNALKFYASVRIDVRGNTQSVSIKDGDQVIGKNMTVKVVKNKVSAPFKTCVIPLYFDKGISVQHEIIEPALKLNLIEKSGAWFDVNGTRLQGSAQVVEYLQDNPHVTDELVAQIKAALLPKKRPAEPLEPEPTDLEFPH